MEENIFQKIQRLNESIIYSWKKFDPILLVILSIYTQENNRIPNSPTQILIHEANNSYI